MTKKHLIERSLYIGLLTILYTFGVAAATSSREILDKAGITGGLVVHLGCGDGTLTASFAGDGFIVHGLDSQPENVASARQHIQSLGLYGQVSVDLFEGKKLPYVDNSVNLIVAENLDAVPREEILWALVPQGVCLVGEKKIVKPRPGGIYSDAPDRFAGQLLGRKVTYRSREKTAFLLPGEQSEPVSKISKPIFSCVDICATMH